MSLATHYGTKIPIDLVITPGTGQKTVSLPAQAASQSTTFQLPPDAQLNPNGDWAISPGVYFKASMSVLQATGTNPINADDLARVLASVKVNDPDVFGVLCDDQVFTGPVLKNLIEFISNNYRNASWDRAQIPTANGTTAIVLYFFIPFAPTCFADGPEMFMLWAGWLKNTIFTFTLSGNTALAAVSANATVSTATVVSGWMETISMRRPPLPPLFTWKRYLSQTATAGNNIIIKNLGDPGSLKNSQKQVRLAFLMEVMNVKGLPGVSALNTITDFWSNQFNQPRTDNPDSMMLALRRDLGHRGPMSLLTLDDGAGFPYTADAKPAGGAMDANGLVFPYRFSSMDQRIQNLMRVPVPADYAVYRDQPSGGPGAGLQHWILSAEISEIAQAGVTSLASKAGIPLTTKVVRTNPHTRTLTANQAYGTGQVIITK